MDKSWSETAWRLKWMRVIGVEVSITCRHEKYPNDVLTVHSWPVMVAGLYPLPIIYGVIGGGVELPFDSNFELKDEIQYVFPNYNFKQLPGTGDLKNNFTIIPVGFLFNL